VRRLTTIARELDLSMAQLALAWILRRSEISSVITGASRVDHVVANAVAADVTLSAEVLATIEEILANRPPCAERLML
jgi:aryl-alcohol dehydrogenase-like predicted oxidoreductase